MYFHTFPFILVAFSTVLAPISFHFLHRAELDFTYQQWHATCHSVEHTHTCLNVVQEACDICSLTSGLHVSSTSSTSFLSTWERGGEAVWQGDKVKKKKTERERERERMKGGLCAWVFVTGSLAVLQRESSQQHQSRQPSPTVSSMTLTRSSVLFDSIGPCWHQLCLHIVSDAQKVGYSEVEKSKGGVT